jgi:hypothetical protein
MKTKTYSCIGAILVVATCVSLAGAQVLLDYNRVANYDVETPSPANWTGTAFGTAWDTFSAVSPTHSLLLDDFSATDTAVWTSDEFAVTPGELLTFGYYAQYFGIAGNFSAGLRFYDAGGLQLSDAGDSITGTLPPGLTDYEHREVKIAVPPGAATAAVRLTTGSTGNEGLANYDDLTVDENILSNGRFELSPNGIAPLDWFHAAALWSWTQTADAPSGYSILKIDDDDTNASSSFRSKGTALGTATELTFGIQSRRANMVGDAFVALRFGDGVDSFGNLQNFAAFADDEVQVMLSGDTVGFEGVAVNVPAIPAGATHVDLRFGTQLDNATTGTLEFDDAFVIVVLAPQQGDINGDGAVDGQDGLAHAQCMGGPDNPPACADPDATRSDFDGDMDVDLADAQLMQQLLGGVEPENLVENGDLEEPQPAGTWPLSWFRAAQGMSWDTEFSTSPTHSIKQVDVWTDLNTGCRSVAQPIPVGTTRIEIAWNWKYENLAERWDQVVAFGTDSDANTGGPGNLLGFFTQQITFAGTGTSDGWETNVIQFDVPAHPTDPSQPVYFDFRIRSWGDSNAWSATGTMWCDDLRVTPLP